MVDIYRHPLLSRTRAIVIRKTLQMMLLQSYEYSAKLIQIPGNCPKETGQNENAFLVGDATLTR